MVVMETEGRWRREGEERGERRRILLSLMQRKVSSAAVIQRDLRIEIKYLLLLLVAC